MLIPLGILDYPVSAAGASSYDLLETEILTGSQATVTFSSLNSTYGADYQHLQIRYVARTATGTGNAGNYYMRFNGDSASNYAWHRMYGDGSSVTSAAGSSQTQIVPAFLDRASDSNIYSMAVIDILDPFETSKYTTTRCLWGGTNSSFPGIGLNSGLWQNTAALTSISFGVPGYDLAIGSRFSLYGLKASA